MTLTPAQLLRGAVVAGLAVAWAFAAHDASAGNGVSDLGVALAAIPVALVPVWLAWRFTGRLAGLAFGGLAIAILFRFWPEVRQNVSLLYFLQHFGINLALALLFGRTLVGPGEALITRLARVVYPDRLSERKIRYTRQATAAWTIFFLGNATLSLALFLFAPMAVWSVYANLLNGPLIALMFVAEHLWRRRVLPPEERPGIAAAIRAWRTHSSKPSA